jgi:hypothetical protein
MTLDLSSACRKLERALFHLNALGDEFEAVARIARGNFSIPQEKIYRHPLGSRHVFPVGELHGPSPNVGPIVGDYLHNLRSALDHLAWEMVPAKYKLPPHDPTAICFPIYNVNRTKKTGKGKPKSFSPAAGKSKLPGVGRSQLAFARRHQPYHRGKWHLGALAAFDNRDKHRTLVPAHVFAQTPIERHHLGATKGRVISWRLLLREGRPVNERTPFLEVIVSEPDARVEMYTTVTTAVAFEERPGRYHQPRALEAIGEAVARILFEAAMRWGRREDAVACVLWIPDARKALGL